MVDYVRRDAVINTVFSMRRKCDTNDIDDLTNMLLAAFEVLPAANKHGQWVGIDDEPCCVFECDICGCRWEDIDGDVPNFCPNCGAYMRGEE